MLKKSIATGAVIAASAGVLLSAAPAHAVTAGTVVVPGVATGAGSVAAATSGASASAASSTPAAGIVTGVPIVGVVAANG
ncbi:hypothetical protein CDO52_25735 [Nocardiopsis gilva YIM 90087]|uniref:DUF320 domain-containing protein n=1 Tax=Nocardiopsis gilva YIM 90087 TaxID=1235441 RepID=A0A223SCF5_9ACTN|nr:hypothetical protein [Nocardiopsis gilva]ASU85753.1 hypothetical protein CDO52_25735 [Nocardiopsis gilva YIM 90087]